MDEIPKISFTEKRTQFPLDLMTHCGIIVLTMNANKKFGLKIIAIAVVFGFFETWYFGWNSFPKSWPEAICDSIVWMMFGYALSFTDKPQMVDEDF